MPLLWHNFVPPNSIGLRQGKNFCAPWESLQSLREEVRLTTLKDSGLTPGLDPVFFLESQEPAETPYEFLFRTPPHTVPLGCSLESS